MAFELVETTQLFARVAPRSTRSGSPRRRPISSSAATPSRTGRRGPRAPSSRSTRRSSGCRSSRDKSVDYASVAPAEARLMFLDHALVRGEYQTRGAFQEKNHELLDEVARLRDKARRSDMLADDDALLAFFDRRVPARSSTARRSRPGARRPRRPTPTCSSSRSRTSSPATASSRPPTTRTRSRSTARPCR